GHGLETIVAFRHFQQFCEGVGITPIYHMDYPVATSPTTREVLGEAIAAGRAEIGIHLHPWVSPPYEEAVNEFNSYAGNLPAALEREKFRQLHAAIEQSLGVSPQIYRAGRYGVGPNS